MNKIKLNLWIAAAGVLIAHSSFSQVKKGVSADGRETTFSAIDGKNEESPLNTVASTGPDGTRFKLIQIGDLLPRLYVNGKLTPTNRLNDYAPLLDKLNHLLWAQQKKAASQNEARNSAQQQAIVNDLVKDGLVKKRQRCGFVPTDFRRIHGER
ncbi:hypothetical protein [Mucilaginibacter flavidus]|uniref:hypothetical protein n=1 Tax=Mucilaginibacter flavidus TaxID=2949309 RepID=UPI002092F217|nr:hypothetical protein [Mucilaginibacter flavidus]MCO5947762.1 hypothetical protein [Mucilaginibacter flavidus]